MLMTKRDYIYVFVTSVLLYSGMFVHISYGNAGNSAFLGWASGTWTALSLINYLEHRT